MGSRLKAHNAPRNDGRRKHGKMTHMGQAKENLAPRAAKENIQNEINKFDFRYAQIKELETKLEEHKRLCDHESDKDMLILLKEEIAQIEGQIKNLTDSLGVSENQIISPDSAILEIRAGTGGDEAGLFAFDLYRMYMRYGEKVKWKTEEIFFSENEAGGIKTALMEIKGKDCYKLLKNESGVHRVQRVPTTESGGRIHTSTATVAVLPVVSKIEIEIKPEDVKMDFFRAGGHGGQNVNKVSTAVRLTHIPTGLVVECQEERSQSKNREKAMGVLKSRIFNMMQEQQVKNISDLRSDQIGTGDRSEKIRTYNYPQDRITDHRLSKSWHNIGVVMNGGIEDMLLETSGLE